MTGSTERRNTRGTEVSVLPSAAPTALPGAVPRSAVPGILWPAAPDPAAATMLALQFQLEQSQWWPRDTIEAWQFEQLRLVLDHARQTVPFYASRFAAADTATAPDRDSWSRIPILTRRDLQLNKNALLSRAVPPGHGAVSDMTTSGSTGQAVTLFATEVYPMLWHAITLREHFWHRRDLAAKLAVIRSRTAGADYPQGLLIPSWGPPADIAYRTGPCAVLNTSCSVSEQAEWLVRQNPDYLLTSPTRARELALHFRKHGPTLPRLREVRSFGEALAADLRDQCRRAWDVPVVDMYSSREIGYIALQCPRHEHYHVQCENVFMEILDERGRACGAGETGRVVLSTLHNFATPLLRYAIGDYAEVGAPCDCGRGLPVLTRIHGRVRNMLRLRDGSARWPNFMLASVYRDLPPAQIQIVQTALDALEVRAVPEGSFSAEDEARLVGHVREWAGTDFRVELRIVAAIPRGAGGKFEEFLSLVDVAP